MSRRREPAPTPDERERECAAPDCEVRFVPQRSTARYHSATCRQRAARARKAAAAEQALGPVDPDAGADAGDAEHRLVRAVRKELIEADALDTVDGQIAMHLARKLTDPDHVSPGLAKELRATIAAAKGAVSGPAEPTPAEAEDDEVTRARENRERKARQASAR